MNNKGFTQYIIMGALALVLISGVVCLTYHLKNKALKAEVKQLKAEVAVLTTANDGLTKTLATEREAHEKAAKTNAKAIAFYQEKLRECLDKPECIEVVVEGCPEVVIEKDVKKDPVLKMLNEIWRW